MPDSKCHMHDMANQLFQAAMAEYKFISLEIKNRQTAIQAQYFWVAFGFITVYSAAFQGVFTGNPFFHLGLFRCLFVNTDNYMILFKILIIFVFAMCAWVILSGIDGLRGRDVTKNFLGKHYAYQRLNTYKANTSATHTDAMINLLKDAQESIDSNIDEAERMGKHLRQTSSILLCAISIGCLTFLL